MHFKQRLHFIVFTQMPPEHVCVRVMRTLLYWHIFDEHTFIWWNINMMMVTQKFICISLSFSLSFSFLVNIENGIFGLLFTRSSISLYISSCYLPFAFHWKVEKKIEIRTDRIFIFICIFIKNNDFEEMAKKVKSSHRRYIKCMYGYLFVSATIFDDRR